MRQQARELRELGVQVCVVTFDAGPLALSYVRQTGLAWPLLIDTDRTLYKAFGVERGSVWNIYGPASLWIYAKLLARGRRLRRPGSDVHQLGGDVLIDPQGIVRLHYIGSGPADRPTVSQLLQTIAPPHGTSPARSASE